MYEVLMKDKGVLSKFKWNYLMVDEAHRLNNSKAAVYVSHVEFRTKIKLLITGTPLQNNVEELRIRSEVDEDFNVFGAKDFFSKLQGLSINHSATMLGRYWHFEKDLGLGYEHIVNGILHSVLRDHKVKYWSAGVVENRARYEHIVKGILHSVLGDYKVKSRSIGVAEVKAFALVLLQGLDYEHIVKGILHSVLGDYKVKSRSIGVAEVKASALVFLQGLEVMLTKTLTYLVLETFSVNYKVWVYNHVATMLGRIGLDYEHIVKGILHSVLGDYKMKSRSIGVAVFKVWVYNHVATMLGRIGLDYEHIVKGILHSVLGDYKLKSRFIAVAELKAFALVLLQGCLMCLGNREATSHMQVD
ncbi:hypothetical protein AgCh_032110 [Apium graveolens]